MENREWAKTTDRFVLFLDILGFKDLVHENTHEKVFAKLESLTNKINSLKEIHELEVSKKLNICPNQTKSATFSDSIIFFSHSNTEEDFIKILFDAVIITGFAISNGIPIKGALSHGKITVDFEKSIFFGKPIIDAYLLHENLQMLTVIADHNFEKQYKLKKHRLKDDNIIVDYKANMKFGKISHKILGTYSPQVDTVINGLQELYLSSSGYPRIYIDNTLEFFISLKNGV